MPVRPTIETLRAVWNALAPLNLLMAVLDGLAVAVHGRLRNTQDVDLLLEIQECDLESMVARLKLAGFRPKRAQPVLQIGDQKIVQLLIEPKDVFMDVQVDILVADNEYQKPALTRRVQKPIQGANEVFDFLDCEDVVLHKLIAGRIIDRADSADLLRHNRATMDMAYLQHWIDKLSLQDEFEEIWVNAFPDEAMPS